MLLLLFSSGHVWSCLVPPFLFVTDSFPLLADLPSIPVLCCYFKDFPVEFIFYYLYSFFSYCSSAFQLHPKCPLLPADHFFSKSPSIMYFCCLSSSLRCVLSPPWLSISSVLSQGLPQVAAEIHSGSTPCCCYHHFRAHQSGRGSLVTRESIHWWQEKVFTGSLKSLLCVQLAVKISLISGFTFLYLKKSEFLECF